MDKQTSMVPPAELEAELSRYGKSGAKWWQIMEKAFIQYTDTEEGRRVYGDPKRGATLDQAWHSVGLMSGVAMICAYVVERVEPPSDIPVVEAMSPSELVTNMNKVLANPRQAIQAFVRGTFAHSITFVGLCDNKLVFTDPWPGKSLLARERNYFGDVNVTEIEPRKWAIDGADLQKVLYAIFLTPSTWALITGVPIAMTFEQLQDSDLFKAFCLRERSKEADDGFITRRVTPGSFREYVQLTIETDLADRLVTSELAIHRDWLRANRRMTAGLAPRFMEACLAIPDRESAKPFVDLVYAIGQDDLAELKSITDQHVETRDFTMAYLGSSEGTSIAFGNCSLDCDNTERAGWLTLRIRIH